MSKQLNDTMRNPESLLGDDKGNVTCYCSKAHLVGYIRLEDAKEFVAKGWCYVETTQDIVHYECTCGHDLKPLEVWDF